MTNYLELNLDTWNKRTDVHIHSKMYNVDAVIAGKCTLKDIELKELGDVQGKQLLHMQCHIGTDSISWARKGAKVTGVDFSHRSIEEAKRIAKEAEVDAKFIQSEITSYSMFTQPIYDIVFASYGVLCWIPDLRKWAQTAANSLKKGGTFFLVEFHPFFDTCLGYSYFGNGDPEIEEEGTYTENCDGQTTTTVTWAHPIGEVTTALVEQGIQIDSLQEYPYSTCNCFDDLEERETGHFYYTKSKHPVPMLYSIKGTKI